MQLINQLSRSAFSLLFGKKENYIVRQSRSEPNTFRVLDDNGAILFQGSLAGCNLFKETMDKQTRSS